MKHSEQISAFLTFLRECELEMDIAESKEKDADNATQDLLHTLELQDVTYHEQAKIAKALKRVREERREAKDQWLLLCPVIEWISANKAVIKGMERMLGDVRKEEKRIENRSYIQRTDIVERTLGEGKETGK